MASDIYLLDFFSYGFIQRAFIAGSLISVACSVLGVILVLKRLSLIGDGLAHVTFGSVAIALALKTHPFLLSIPISALSSIGIMKLIKHTKVYSDAAIGIVSSVGIATGIICASLGGGFNVDIFSILFGSILAVTNEETLTSAIVSIVVILLVLRYYKEILSVTFDEELAKVSGIKTDFINNVIALLTSVTIVLAMKLVGIMLTSALIILPAMSAFQNANSFKSAMIHAVLIALFTVNTGIFTSFILNLPTGSVIVMLNLLVFVVATVIKRYRFATLRVSDRGNA
ncbi:MAG: metal ABC transporter permease [Thermodesulfovibrionales bacterium]|nr:metal ABC transporter permease [Thermodesulfovibrionales bacterium]